VGLSYAATSACIPRWGVIRPPPRSHTWLWTVIGALLAGEVLSLYLLCVQEMQRAELRRQLLQAQARAISECLASLRGATIARCNRLRVAVR